MVKEKILNICKVCKGVHKEEKEFTEVELIKNEIYFDEKELIYKIPFVCANCFGKEIDIKQIEEAGLPVTMIEYDSTKGNQLLYDFVKENFHNSMFIKGDYNIGKTRTVVHAGIKCLEKGEKVLFYSAPDMMREIMGMFCHNMREADLLIKKIIHSDILILDDLGREKITERAAETFYSIIDGKYRNGKRIWVTSNYPLEITCNRITMHEKAIFRRFNDICKIW